MFSFAGAAPHVEIAAVAAAEIATAIIKQNIYVLVAPTFKLMISGDNEKDVFKKFIIADYTNNTKHFYDLYSRMHTNMVLSKADYNFMKIVADGTNTPAYKLNIEKNMNSYINYLSGIANTNGFNIYKFAATDIIL